MPANVDEIISILQEIEAGILRHPSWGRGSGTLINEPTHQSEQEEIDELRSKLARATLMLNREKSRIDFRDQVAARTPRGNRRRSRRHFDSRRAGLGSVYKLAAQILRDLETLDARNASVSLPDLVAGFADLQLQEVEAREELQHIMQEHQAHYSNLRADTLTLQNVPLSFLLVVMIGVLALRGKAGRG